MCPSLVGIEGQKKLEKIGSDNFRKVHLEIVYQYLQRYSSVSVSDETYHLLNSPGSSFPSRTNASLSINFLNQEKLPDNPPRLSQPGLPTREYSTRRHSSQSRVLIEVEKILIPSSIFQLSIIHSVCSQNFAFI